MLWIGYESPLISSRLTFHHRRYNLLTKKVLILLRNRQSPSSSAGSFIPLKFLAFYMMIEPGINHEHSLVLRTWQSSAASYLASTDLTLLTIVPLSIGQFFVLPHL
jgi:hypothetical protein